MFVGIPRAPKSKPFSNCSNYKCKCHDCRSSARRGGLCTNCYDCCKGKGTSKVKCIDYKK